MTTETSQVSRDELEAMTPDAVYDAFVSGRLDALLGRRVVDPTDPTGEPGTVPQVTLADIRSMTPDQVAEAYAAGRLKTVMGGTTC